MSHPLTAALDALAHPERAVNRTVLASLVAIIVVSNLIGLSLYRLLGLEGGVMSFGGFLIAALSLETTLLAFLLLASRATLAAAASTLRSDGWRSMVAWVWSGLMTGPLLFFVSALVQVALALLFEVRQTQLEDLLWVRALSPAEFLVVLAVGAGLAPLTEEWFFRGYVFSAYLKARGPVWAYLASAGLFSLLHLNLPAAPPIFAMGLVLAWVYQRGGALAPCVVAHGFNNAVALTIVYTMPAPS